MHPECSRQRGTGSSWLSRLVRRGAGWLLPSLALLISLHLAAQNAGSPAQPLLSTDQPGYTFVPGIARDLVQDGRWLRDAQGRYVLFRGVNFGSRNKLKPYLPIMPLAATTLDEAQLRAEMLAVKPQLVQLKSLGMNVIRLPVMWEALEPEPNPNLDELLPEAVTYLQQVQEIIDELYRNGMFVIVDFHQDIVCERFGGDGFPEWALAPVFKGPRTHRKSDTNWVTNYYAPPWWARWICQCSREHRGVMKTLRLFWNGGETGPIPKGADQAPAADPDPQTHFVKTVGQVVKFFAQSNGRAGDPAILGYEPFNEPQQAGLDKQDFESKLLPGFYHRTEAEIAKYDSTALVFIEPRSDWTTYSATGPDYQALHFTLHPKTYFPSPYLPSGPNHGVFSFHYYDPWMMVGRPFSANMKRKSAMWPKFFQSMSDTADATWLVPFLTEFGCGQDWKGHTNFRPHKYERSVVRACMDLQYSQVEERLLNATYWNYDLYNSEEGKDNWNGQDFSLLGPGRSPRNLDIVARPYPMRSSAKPERVFFDLETKNAAFVFGGPVSDAPTVIYVPALNYPGKEFEVRATTAASSVAWDEANQLLYWYPDRTAAQNQLILSPIGRFDARVLPTESRSLLPQTPYLMVVNRGRREPIDRPGGAQSPVATEDPLRR